MKTNWNHVVLAWVAMAASISPLNLPAAALEFSPAAITDRKEGEFVPVLKTKTLTYTNVTLRAISETDVFISHPGGVLNLKLNDFQPESLALVEAVRTKLPKMAGKPAVEPEKKKVSLPASWAMDFKLGDRELKLSPEMVAGLAVGLVFGWWFFAWCCHLICVKSVTNPSILVWLPVFQIFPLLRAAHMPWWWFLVSLVAAPVVAIVWAVKVVQVRKKGMWLTVLLILPVTSLFGFLFLAFSRGLTAEEHRRMDMAMKKPTTPAPLVSQSIRFHVAGKP